jgi:shikimate kinase
MNIILIGFKKTGKTTIGKALAAALRQQFTDTDKCIENDFYQTTEMKFNARKIHDWIGDQAFRSLEKKAIHSLLDIENAVISTGGGSLLDPDNVANLKKIGKLIYLNTPFDVLLERFRYGKLPTFVDANDVKGSLERVYQERAAIYEKNADIIINTEKMSIPRIVKAILEKL